MSCSTGSKLNADARSDSSLPRMARKPLFQSLAVTPMPTMRSVHAGSVSRRVSPTLTPNARASLGEIRASPAVRGKRPARSNVAPRSTGLSRSRSVTWARRAVLPATRPIEPIARPCTTRVPAGHPPVGGVTAPVAARFACPNSRSKSCAAVLFVVRTRVVTTVIPMTGTATRIITSNVRPQRRRTSRLARRAAIRHPPTCRSVRSCASASAKRRGSAIVVIARPLRARASRPRCDRL